METSNLVTAFSTYLEADMQEHDTSYPSGVAVNRHGNLVIVDNEVNNVKVFTPQGDLLYTFGNGQFVSAWDVFCTNSGKMVVSDCGTSELKVYSKQGKYLLKSELGTHIKELFGIAYNRTNSMMAVTDKASCCAYIHAGSGVVQELLRITNADQNIPNMSCPQYITYSQSGDVLISDFDSHCVYAFNESGELLWTFGNSTTEDQALGHPAGICTDRQGNILVADTGNCRVIALTPEGKFKDFVLTWEDGIAEPQAIATTKKGELIVTEGSTGVVKIFKCNLP